MRPTHYLGTSPAEGGWSNRDRALAEALLIHEGSVGPHGQPMRLALDDDNDGWFEVETKTDHAQAAIDRWREDEGKNAEPGTFPTVVFTRDETPVTPAADASQR